MRIRYTEAKTSTLIIIIINIKKPPPQVLFIAMIPRQPTSHTNAQSQFPKHLHYLSQTRLAKAKQRKPPLASSPQTITLTFSPYYLYKGLTYIYCHPPKLPSLIDWLIDNIRKKKKKRSIQRRKRKKDDCIRTTNASRTNPIHSPQSIHSPEETRTCN